MASRKTKKIKKNKVGGGLSPELQKKLLHELSILLALGSLGVVSWCTIKPIVSQILSWFEEAGGTSISIFFYELLWTNVINTMAAVKNAAASGLVALGSGAELLSSAGNTCAVTHGMIRLANPLYKFFLGNLKRIIDIMENPLIANTKLQEVPKEIISILEKITTDYGTLGTHAIKGADKTGQVISRLSKKIKTSTQAIVNELFEKIPTQSAAEKKAQEENKEWFNKYVEFINDILTKVTDGIPRMVPDLCTPAAYAKQWIVFFFSCFKAKERVEIEHYVIPSRDISRTPSPPGSPTRTKARSPSPHGFNSLLSTMMRTPSTGRGISESPEPIEPIVTRVGEACPRAQSAPPQFSDGSIVRKRVPRASSAMPAIDSPTTANARKASARARLEPIPEMKDKLEGGRKKTYKRKRRGTYKTRRHSRR